VHLEELLAEISEDLKELNGDGREGSRYVGPNATAAAARKAAERKSAFATEGYRIAEHGGSVPLPGAEFLRTIKAARQGDGDAFRRLARKGWVESGNAGFLVTDDVLPQMVEMRRASAPLAAFCSQYQTDSDQVTIITEGDSVQVEFTGEGVTKLDSTGTVGTKLSVVHKLAGTTHVSDELLADSRNVESLISRQFAQAIDIAQDAAIIAGTGIGEPVGILNTVGVLQTPVSGQSGQELYESILGAISRRVQALYMPTVVVLHPREWLKFKVAKDLQDRYLFASFAGMFPDAQVVLDPNLPTTLGTGTDESVIIVGDLRSGAYVFNRQPLTLDASSDAAFLSDETVFRAVRRWGFSVVKPDAIEVLTEIAP
jgi:HK97 family phage major capsid protein